MMCALTSDDDGDYYRVRQESRGSRWDLACCLRAYFGLEPAMPSSCDTVYIEPWCQAILLAAFTAVVFRMQVSHPK